MSDQGQKRHILIIDDDYAVSATLEPYFKAQGFPIKVARTGAAGVQDALAHLPSVVLMSTMLLDGPGLDVFKQLRGRARTANIPIMFLARHQEARLQNDFLSAGADDFILKPFDVDILGLRVKNAIKRQEREGVNHPRSGLATGRLILEREDQLRSENGWYKIDFGIDSFNAFRDQYGFMTGEEVIQFAAKLVNEAVQEAGTAEDFIGHRDDTDFVIVTRLEKGPALREVLEKRFNEEVLSFYNFAERDEGAISMPDGNGGIIKKPLMSAKIKVQEGEPAE
jgi:PleD family two-component response regulator